MNSLSITSAISNLARYNPAPEPEARNDPEIAVKTLGLEEITDSEASSLLSSLVTSKKSAHESQIEFSNLSINPERVAKVAKALLHLGPLQSFVRWCLSGYSRWRFTLGTSWSQLLGTSGER